MSMIESVNESSLAELSASIGESARVVLTMQILQIHLIQLIAKLSQTVCFMRQLKLPYLQSVCF